VNDPSDGLLDTNIFIHSLTSDARSAECRSFLAALEFGMRQAWLDPLVLHELSYSMRHYLKQATKEEIAEYMLGVLRWPGVQGDKDLMTDAVQRWGSTPGLAFVDAYISALALRRNAPVYTMNVRELTSQGVTVPQPLPS
jgi:predicted nucleic acid-binding protein